MSKMQPNFIQASLCGHDLFFFFLFRNAGLMLISLLLAGVDLQVTRFLLLSILRLCNGWSRELSSFYRKRRLKLEALNRVYGDSEYSTRYNYIISYHIISHYIISYHIISYHITSYHIISYHIISYHIISYHIISYHIISLFTVGKCIVTKN